MRLTAYLNGVRVGWFEQSHGGEISLEYDRGWQNVRSRIELSLSLPKSRRVHTGTAPGNYLWNLLPDNDAVLERWGRTFGVSPRNPMRLLAHVGLDAAGAVQLVDTDEYDEPRLAGEGEITAISEAEIAAHLRELRRDPSAWVARDGAGGYFSLAGAQSKFTLASTGGKWGMPRGRAASTHIVKPGVVGLRRSDLNEHLTMRAAHHLGLTVSNSRMLRFEDQTAIVVTRFDRARGDDGEVYRLHQEDFAQATGRHPLAKYQNEGGPGISAIGRLLAERRDRSADADVARFFDATLFNWAVLGTDAHAKNYALVYPTVLGTAAARFAPLYDLGSALAYPDINNRRATLAMSFGRHYRASEIEPRHLVAEGVGLGLTEDHVFDRGRQIVDGMTDAFGHAVAEAGLTGEDAEFAAVLVGEASERAEVLARQLDRPA